MIPELAYIAAAAALSLILFTALDLFWKLPKEGGVSGADAVSREITASGGDQNGGWMLGNIICSPDASAGTLLAACGYWICGIPGGIAAAHSPQPSSSGHSAPTQTSRPKPSSQEWSSPS